MKRSWLLLALAVALVTSTFATDQAFAQGAVAGVVIDENGDPVEGAVVTIQSAVRVRGERPFVERFQTEENGRFGWRQVPQGRYVVIAGAREVGLARVRAGVRDGEITRLEIQLQARGERERPRREFGSIAGQVVDAEGNPVAGAVVSMFVQRGEERGVRHVGVRVRTNERGVFEIERAPVGNVVLAAAARGGLRGRTVVEVEAGEATRARIELQGRG